METQAAMMRNAHGFETMVQRVYLEEWNTRGYQGTLESVLSTHFAGMATQSHAWKREAFRDILLLFYAKRCYAVIRNPGYIGVLANVSAFANKTVRDMQGWKKDSLTAEGQLASFIRYCFAEYEVPAFMENVFAGSNKVHMLWYVQLGRGESVQQLSAFPVKFTKRMAHEFRLAPKDYTVAQAIRRAQALGYGANASRAEAVAWSALPECFEQEAFWGTVVQFVAKGREEITFDVLQQVLGYIAAMYALNATFSMKGRTWTALARQAAEWHAEEARRMHAVGYCEWNLSAIRDMIMASGKVTYRIMQLASSEALYEEGCEMSHCVAEYADQCAEGNTAIFSLRKVVEGKDGSETLATIEVHLPTYEIVQAKARYNEGISPEAYDVIIAWAKKEGLEVDEECCYDDLPFHAAPPAAIVPRPGAAPPQQPGLYRPYDAYSDIEAADIAKYIFFLIKILIVVAKCSQ